MSPDILTFGCRLNASESESIAVLAAGLGDALIINTCAVTAEAERQARQAIRKASRESPGRRILVTGCAAEISPGAWAALPGVERVVANAAKLLPESWAAPGAAPIALPPPGLGSRARAFVPVQQGCDHRCTFCVIPAGRGPSRSLPVGAVVEQVRGLVARGYNEVVMTGVDIASYGADLPGRPTLGQMARRLLALVPGLPRLRLSSLDPAGMDDDLWRLIAEEPRFMPHLHLSLQHGADLILKRMKRRHGRAEAVALCARARRLRPDIAFGADLIAGFPTETEAHLAELLALVDECGLSFLHVFPYSARSATPAASMPQLPMLLRRERAARLREAGRRAARRFCEARLGQLEQVLLEAPDRGHSAHFAPVRLRGAAGRRGEIRSLRAVAVQDEELIAEAA